MRLDGQDLAAVQLSMQQERAHVVSVLKKMGAQASETQYGPAVFSSLTPGHRSPR